MKKIILSTFIAVLLLTGCTNQEETNNESQGEPLVLEEIAVEFNQELIPVNDLNGGVVIDTSSFTIGDGMQDTVTIGINKDGNSIVKYVRTNLETLGIYEETSDSTDSFYEATGHCYFSGTYNGRNYYIEVEDTEEYTTTVFFSLKREGE